MRLRTANELFSVIMNRPEYPGTVHVSLFTGFSGHAGTMNDNHSENVSV